MKPDLDFVQTKEQQMRATGLLAWAVANDSRISDATDRLGAFRQRGGSRFIKSSVDPMLTTDTAVSLGPLQAAFVGLVDAESVLGRLDGAVRIPLGAAARLQVGTITAAAVAELASKPVMALAFTTAGPGSKVEASIVISSEALRALDAGTQSGITQVLVSACAAAVDRALVAVLTAGSPAGSATPGALLAAVSGGQPRRPYLLGGFDTLLGLDAGTLRDLRELGVGILPTAAASGLLIALDASGLLVSDGPVLVETARHADVLLDDGTGSPAGTSVVSLWQQNLVSVRCERWLRLALRDGAAAYSSTGSPA